VPPLLALLPLLPQPAVTSANAATRILVEIVHREGE
jgi:hypothetical protein